MILTDGPRQIPFAPLPLEWLEQPMLRVIPATIAHLWTYLWSRTDHHSGCLPERTVYTHKQAAEVLDTSERTIGTWFAKLEDSGWLESVRLRNGLRYRLRRVPPLGQPTGAPYAAARRAAREPQAASDPDPVAVPPEPQAASDPGAASGGGPGSEATRAAGAAGSEISCAQNGSQLPSLQGGIPESFPERGGERAAAVVPGGRDSTRGPGGPQMVGEAAALAPPVSKELPRDGPARGESAYYRDTERAASELREYLWGEHPLKLDAGVRRAIAYALHDRSSDFQREVLLRVGASFKADHFEHVRVPQYWDERLVEATALVEARRREREAVLWRGYASDDPRYPGAEEPGVADAKARARAALAEKSERLVTPYDPQRRGPARAWPVGPPSSGRDEAFRPLRDVLPDVVDLQARREEQGGDAASNA